MSWNFGLALLFRLRSSAELRLLALPMGAGLDEAVAGELLPDLLGDDLTLIFFNTCFLADEDEGVMARLLVLDEGDPLELRVELLPINRLLADLLFNGLLLPTLALCWRPLLDILGAVWGRRHPVRRNS